LLVDLEKWTMHEWSIEAKNLGKQFARKKAVEPNQNAVEKTGARRWLPSRHKTETTWFTAVEDVSLKIQRGEIFGLLGPNGAGKTTTIRMLCTLLEPSAGTAIVNGFDIRKQPNQVRQSLGTVLGGERSIYWKLTARENLEYFAALYHIPPGTASRRITELLERMELSERADDPVEKYSSGMKQRVAISRALLSRPPVILLDEPTLGLDPQAARRLRQLILELKHEGHTILLTTHYMEEADQLSDRIGIIDKGKIIALDTPAKLKQLIDQKDIIHLEVSGWQEQMLEPLQDLPLVDQVSARYLGIEEQWELSIQTGSSRQVLPALIERVNQNGTRLVNMNVLQPSLEDVFIALTGKALRD
jgi:ABC-2 type transport system ATP-binding protein